MHVEITALDSDDATQCPANLAVSVHLYSFAELLLFCVTLYSVLPSVCFFAKYFKRNVS